MLFTRSYFSRKALELGLKTFGFGLIFTACAGNACALPTPEIDPGSISGALGLLSGGVMLLLARKKS